MGIRPRLKKMHVSDREVPRLVSMQAQDSERVGRPGNDHAEAADDALLV